MRGITLIALMLIFFSCSPGSIRNKSSFEFFRVGIEQDGMEKDIENTEVLLYKKPFTLIISFNGPDGIFVNASVDPQSYNLARDGVDLARIKSFDETVVAEESLDNDEVLIISKTSSNFLYYENENDHQFDIITAASGILQCRKKISTLINLDVAKKKLNIAEIKDDAIYLVFMKLDWNENFSKKIEKKRYCLKIIFK